MLYMFNRIYQSFNGVPVYAISGHGLPYIDLIASPHDGIVYWSDFLLMNKSPFAICHSLDPYGIFVSDTETFTGYSNFYTPNGHHFPFWHTNLVTKGVDAILKKTIILKIQQPLLV